MTSAKYLYWVQSTWRKVVFPGRREQSHGFDQARRLRLSEGLSGKLRLGARSWVWPVCHGKYRLFEYLRMGQIDSKSSYSGCGLSTTFPEFSTRLSPLPTVQNSETKFRPDASAGPKLWPSDVFSDMPLRHLTKFHKTAGNPRLVESASVHRPPPLRVFDRALLQASVHTTPAPARSVPGPEHRDP